ncbi:hypothetical protein C3L33_18056, partial [Rhododendron williamsianum]
MQMETGEMMVVISWPIKSRILVVAAARSMIWLGVGCLPAVPSFPVEVCGSDTQMIKEMKDLIHHGRVFLISPKISVPRNLVPESRYRRMVEISVPQYLKRESWYSKTSFRNLGTAEWWKSRYRETSARNLGTAKLRREISVPQNSQSESRYRETTGESRYHETSTRKLGTVIPEVGISVPRNLVPESQYRRMVEISVPQYLKRESRYRETSFWNLGSPLRNQHCSPRRGSRFKYCGTEISTILQYRDSGTRFRGTEIPTIAVPVEVSWHRDSPVVSRYRDSGMRVSRYCGTEISTILRYQDCGTEIPRRAIEILRTLAGTERLLGNAGSNQAELGQELGDCLKTSVETGQNSNWNWNWEVARKCQQNS